LTHSYQFFHTPKISKANSSITERQKNDEAFFLPFFKFFCELHRNENSIILLPFQAFRRCVSNVSHLDFFFPFFSHVEESAEKVSRYEPEIDLLRAKMMEELFFVFLIERPITLFY
jgi:hypothetical protein